MIIVARRARTSTCPLCRADVARSEGETCAVCSAVVHAECVRELGGCHEHGTEVGTRLTRVEPIPRTWVARRNRAALRRNSTGESARPQPPESEWELTGAMKAALVGLLVAMICSGVKAGFLAAIGTGLFGFIGCFNFSQVWSGLRTGVVETSASDSNEQHSWESSPLSFLYHLGAWALMGLAFTGLALGPFFFDQPK